MKILLSKAFSNNIQSLLNYPNYYYGKVIVCCEEVKLTKKKIKGLSVYVNSDDHPENHFHLETVDGKIHYKVYVNENGLIDDSEKSWKKIGSDTVNSRQIKTVVQWFNSEGYCKFEEEWKKVMDAYNAKQEAVK